MKTATLFFLLLTINLVSAQIIQFDDSNFKNALLTHNPVIDTNSDGEIQVSEAEVVLRLHIASQNISSLDGIAYFLNLEWLDCPDNSINSLDLSQNHNIFTVWCRNNQMTNINVNNATALEFLQIEYNNITNIDLGDCSSLYWVQAYSNQLESIDISQISEVIYLSLWSNNLTMLNVKNHTSSLTLLDTRNNPNLGCIMVDDVNFANAQTCSDDFWCQGSSSYFSEDCTLAADNFNNIEFSLYPNPVENILNINSKKVVENAEVYTINGRLIQEVSDKNNIDVSELNTGIYFVTITISGVKITKRFLKI